MIAALGVLQTALDEYTRPLGIAAMTSSASLLSAARVDGVCPLSSVCDAMDCVVRTLTTTPTSSSSLRSSASTQDFLALIHNKHTAPIHTLAAFLLAPLTSIPGASFVDKEESLARLHIVTLSSLRKIMASWCRRGDAEGCAAVYTNQRIISSVLHLFSNAIAVPESVRVAAAETLFAFVSLCPPGVDSVISHNGIAVLTSVLGETNDSKNSSAASSVVFRYYVLAILERVSLQHPRELILFNEENRIVTNVLIPNMRLGGDVATASALVLMHMLRVDAAACFTCSSDVEQFLETVFGALTSTTGLDAAVAVARVLTTWLELLPDDVAARVISRQCVRKYRLHDVLLKIIIADCAATVHSSQAKSENRCRAATAAAQLLRVAVLINPHAVAAKIATSTCFLRAISALLESQHEALENEFVLCLGIALCVGGTTVRYVVADALRSYAGLRTRLKRLVASTLPRIPPGYVYMWSLRDATTNDVINHPKQFVWDAVEGRPRKSSIRLLFEAQQQREASAPHDVDGEDDDGGDELGGLHDERQPPTQRNTSKTSPALEPSLLRQRAILTLWLAHAAFHVTLNSSKATASSRASTSPAPCPSSLSPRTLPGPSVSSSAVSSSPPVFGSSRLDRAMALILAFAKKYKKKVSGQRPTSPSLSAASSRSSSVTSVVSSASTASRGRRRRPHDNPYAPRHHSPSLGMLWSVADLQPSDVWILELAVEDISEKELYSVMRNVERHISYLRLEATKCPMSRRGRHALLNDLLHNVYPRVFVLLKDLHDVFTTHGTAHARALVRTAVCREKSDINNNNNNNNFDVLMMDTASIHGRNLAEIVQSVKNVVNVVS
eukprot:PhM_4_TR15508/c0_g1_i1/m.48563